MAGRENAVISIVMPVYNEGAHIKTSVGTVENLLKEYETKGRPRYLVSKRIENGEEQC